MFTAHNLHTVCASDVVADFGTPVVTVTALVRGTFGLADVVFATVDTVGEDFTVCDGNGVVFFGNVVVVVVRFVVVTDVVVVVVVVCFVVATDVVTPVSIVTVSVVSSSHITICNKYYQLYTNKQIMSIFIPPTVIELVGT
jgi:hypothetical protein